MIFVVRLGKVVGLTEEVRAEALFMIQFARQRAAAVRAQLATGPQ